MIELVACDMAGTTVDEHDDVYRALREAVEATGNQVSANHVQTWMGADKREAITALISLGGGMPAPGVVDAAFDDFRARLTAYYRESPPTSLPGVEQALAALRSAGIKVALTTGFSRDVADDILETLGWGTGAGGNLDAVVTSDEVPLGRPAPDMIHRAMELTGVVDLACVLAVGDTANDLAAARNAGVGALGVLTGKLGRAELSAFPHDGILDGVADLPAYLGLTVGPFAPAPATGSPS